MKKSLRLCVAIGIFILNSMMLFAADKKVLVVYFSRDGHTHTIAQKLAQTFDADSERLIDKKNRIGMFATMTAGKDALAHNTTEIQPLTNNPDDYSIILIGTPAWFSNMAPAVRTFIEKYRLEDKTVGLFSTCHRVGADKATMQMAELISVEKSHSYPQLPLTHHDMEERILSEKIKQFKSAVESYQ